MKKVLFWCAGILLIAGYLYSGTVVKTNTFTDGAVIEASEFNTNFDTLYNVVNGNLDSANLAADSVGASEIDESEAMSFKNVTIPLGEVFSLEGGSNTNISCQSAGIISFYTNGLSSVTVNDNSLIVTTTATLTNAVITRADITTVDSEVTFSSHVVITGSVTASNIGDGNYTAVSSDLTGVCTAAAMSGGADCFYQRIGDIVTVSGRVDITTSGAGAIGFDITLPAIVTNNFASDNEAHGTFNTNGNAGLGYILAVSGTKKVEFVGAATGALSGVRSAFMVQLQMQ